MALDITVEKPKGISIAEKGRSEDGTATELDRRLFMQLQVFAGASDTDALIAALEARGIPGVLYLDLLDATGVGLVTYSDDPSFFVDDVRGFLNEGPFADLDRLPDRTMTGRSYAIGYEKDLEDTLIRRPIRHACNPDWPWAVWYPLRRRGDFATLPADEQRTMLMEHGGIGRAYGKADHGHDIRLSCHGLDRNDNDFVVALIGKNLAPLSKIVERMRSTRQTAEFIDQMGPFFIGKAVWQNAVIPEAE